MASPTDSRNLDENWPMPTEWSFFAINTAVLDEHVKAVAESSCLTEVPAALEVAHRSFAGAFLAELQKAGSFYNEAESQLLGRHGRARTAVLRLMDGTRPIDRDLDRATLMDLKRLATDLVSLERFSVSTYQTLSAVLAKHDQVSGLNTRDRLLKHIESHPIIECLTTKRVISDCHALFGLAAEHLRSRPHRTAQEEAAPPMAPAAAAAAAEAPASCSGVEVSSPPVEVPPPPSSDEGPPPVKRGRGRPKGSKNKPKSLPPSAPGSAPSEVAPSGAHAAALPPTAQVLPWFTVSTVPPPAVQAAMAAVLAQLAAAGNSAPWTNQPAPCRPAHLGAPPHHLGQHLGHAVAPQLPQQQLHLLQLQPQLQLLQPMSFEAQQAEERRRRARAALAAALAMPPPEPLRAGPEEKSRGVGRKRARQPHGDSKAAEESTGLDAADFDSDSDHAPADEPAVGEAGKAAGRVGANMAAEKKMKRKKAPSGRPRGRPKKGQTVSAAAAAGEGGAGEGGAGEEGDHREADARILLALSTSRSPSPAARPAALSSAIALKLPERPTLSPPPGRPPRDDDTATRRLAGRMPPPPPPPPVLAQPVPSKAAARFHASQVGPSSSSSPFSSSSSFFSSSSGAEAEAGCVSRTPSPGASRPTSCEAGGATVLAPGPGVGPGVHAASPSGFQPGSLGAALFASSLFAEQAEQTEHAAAAGRRGQMPGPSTGASSQSDPSRASSSSSPLSASGLLLRVASMDRSLSTSMDCSSGGACKDMDQSGGTSAADALHAMSTVGAVGAMGKARRPPATTAEV